MTSVFLDKSVSLPISINRFDKGPYFDFYHQKGNTYGVYADRYFPISVGNNVESAYWSLRRKAVMYDVPEKPIQIEGPQAPEYLDKIFSRKISDMKVGRGKYAIACYEDGGIFIDGVFFRLEENKFWYVQPDGHLQTWLKAHQENYNVKISDPKSRVLQIQGPASIDIMKAASNGKIDENMPYYRSGFFDLGGQNLFVSRSGFTNELGFEIYSDGFKTDHLALWDHLMSCGKPFGMELSATRAMTIRRIEAGIFGNLTDIDTSINPFEAGLGFCVNMDKEDFIGRDALLNKDKGTCLFGLTCETETPVSGSKVLDGDKIVGYITAGVHSLTLDTGIGYVRFYEPKDWPGKKLILKLPNGENHKSKIVNLPFFDPEKKIVKGIDRNIPEQTK